MYPLLHPPRHCTDDIEIGPRHVSPVAQELTAEGQEEGEGVGLHLVQPAVLHTPLPARHAVSRSLLGVAHADPENRGEEMMHVGRVLDLIAGQQHQGRAGQGKRYLRVEADVGIYDASDDMDKLFRQHHARIDAKYTIVVHLLEPVQLLRLAGHIHILVLLSPLPHLSYMSTPSPSSD
eukprot:758458-Hanusia_phi.AAC.7